METNLQIENISHLLKLFRIFFFKNKAIYKTTVLCKSLDTFLFIFLPRNFPVIFQGGLEQFSRFSTGLSKFFLGLWLLFQPFQGFLKAVQC